MLYEDAAIIYKLISNANKISFLDDELYVYIIRKKSITNSFSEEALSNKIIMKNEMYEYVNNKYPELKMLNIMSKIKFIYRYFSSVGRFLKISVLKNNAELVKEYDFYKNNYKSVKKIITQYNILYNVLFYSRTLFYILIKIRYKIKYN